MNVKRVRWGCALAALAICVVNFFPFAFRDFPHLWPASILAAAMSKGLLHPLDQRGWPFVVFGGWIAWAILFTMAYARLRRTDTVLEGAGLGLLLGCFVAVPQALMEIGVCNIPVSVFLLQAGISLGVAVVDGILAAVILRAVTGTRGTLSPLEAV
ncbi:MAG TPA: hypothetical protein VGX76_22810 [Pirellulales bacterium]|jgi:hypothetical protein|nr:hypothetical protein [Pirellulales bacterium]